MTAIKIYPPTFEHGSDGFGTNHKKPRISWSFAGDNIVTDWHQSSYEIQIAHGHEKPTTYHLEGSQSVLVPWPSRALASRESAWVKVRSHGRGVAPDGAPAKQSTEWSVAVTLEAALLDKSDWTAKMITPATKQDPTAPIRPMLFRRAFSLPGNTSGIKKARLYSTAHGVYKALLNGVRIGSEEMAPGWTSYRHRLLYQVFDVTTALRPIAVNVIGFEVAEGWFAGRLGFDNRRCLYGDRLAFLAQLEVAFQDGETYTLESNGEWMCYPSPITRSEIYDGEDYDARKERTGWVSDVEFNQDDWEATEEIAFPSAALIAAELPPVRIMDTTKPVKIFKSRSGKTLVDFGQNIVGKLQVRLPPAPAAGHKLSFSHAEVLEREELGTRPLRDAKPIDNVFLSSSQPKLWSPQFTFHGFRYVQIDGWPADEMPSHDDITALVMHSDMKRIGWFSCSEPLVNKLHENTVWSLKGNFLSIPTDCPQRDERLGWTGDIQVFTPSASFLYNVNSFLNSWLDDMTSEQLEAGGVPGLVVPNIFDKPTPPGPQCAWHDVAVLTPWDLYNSSGDVAILRRQYNSMKAWVDQGIPRGANGLWDQDVWQYGDWLDPSAPPDQPGNGSTDSHLVADAHLVHVLETMYTVSSLLGEVDDASRYAEEASKTKKLFQSEYITPSGLVVGDTTTAYSLAIMFGLLDGTGQLRKSGSRLSHLVHNADYRISTGFVGTPLITHALTRTGNAQVAYRMLLEKACPSWLYPISMGATTIWERWDSMLPDGSINPGTMTSFNHYALGSVVDWLHKTVGGISPAEPGWKKILVQPVPGGTLTSANVAYDGPYGRIECAWGISQDRTFSLSVVVPPNCTAVVILPSTCAGVADRTEEGVVVGSGAHAFSCKYDVQDWPPTPDFARSTFRLGV
ncbi:hypothetical protein PWT90_01086 [Aphanocladium album]|nr:hypothetical protein PWT90_01086 [Aphanocladium album]